MDREEFLKVGEPGKRAKSYLNDGRTFEGTVRRITPDGYVRMDVTKLEDPLGIIVKPGQYMYPLNLVVSVVPAGYNFEEDAQ